MVILKEKVLVIFGGVSSEHDVSLVSASYVIDNIPREKYDVLKMGITKEGRCFLYGGESSKICDGSWISDTANLESAVISCDRSHHGIIHLGSGEIERIDVVFPVLHGKNGEDGTMQGLLEISGIPYVGCGTAASAVCMDKALTNAMADFKKIPQAKWTAFNKSEYEENGSALTSEAAEYLGFPVFVKPANAGSSVGITKAKNIDELKAACELAFEHDDKIVLEECVTGKEVEVAVLGNNDPVASVPGEIVPCNEFYDYEAKYLAQGSKLLIPADLSDEKIKEVQQAAVRAYKALGCRGLARVDFFVRDRDGAVMLNEPNTIPGFTSISMYPKLFNASGIPYAELLDRLICLALEK